jgi:DNA-directed RNA polymerase specialized sigma24 family protein
MSVDETVSAWIMDLKGGDSVAAQRLWERYFQRLVGLSRRVLKTTPRQAADEEDVALSAFNSFCHRASHGKFPQLEDRDDLWKLLMTITVRKAIQLTRKARRRPAANELDLIKDQIAGQEPTPEFAAAVKDEFERLLDSLGDEDLRQMALWKLEGLTNPEIAERVGHSVSFVGRKLRLIRRVWAEEDPT